MSRRNFRKPFVQRLSPILVLTCLVALLGLPARPTAAVIIVNETVTQTQNDFATGKFGLTGLAQSGGVQLVPLGVLKLWQTLPNGTLCRKVGSHGAVSFGHYMYVIGGLTGAPNSPNPLKEVCRTEVLATDGRISGWSTTASEDLPDVRFSMGVAAAPLPNNPNSGIIVVAGGQDANQDSVDTVWAATINPDGSLGTWRTQPKFPGFESFRSRFPMTAYHSDLAGKTWVYAFGGRDQGFSPQTFQSVVRAEVTAAGDLTDWVTIDPIPVPLLFSLPAQCQSLIGLTDSAATNFDVVTVANGDKRMLALIGGEFQIALGQQTGSCPADSQASQRVFLAEINPLTGDLTWQTGAANEYTLPEPLSHLGAVGLNQKIYTAGGLIGAAQDTSTKAVMTSYVNEDLQLPTFAQGNFLRSDTALLDIWARSDHGLVTVTINNRPIAYLLGGIQKQSNAFIQDVVFGFIGLDDDVDTENNVAYADTGLYLSAPFQMRAPAKVTGLNWTAAVSRTGSINTDIQMEVRVASSPTALNTAEWVPVDGDTGSAFYSVSGANTGNVITSTIGSYVQYRALLTTDQPQDRNATPILSGPVQVRYEVDGYPELHVDDAQFPTIQQGVTIEPQVIIGNSKPAGSTVNKPILDTDIEGIGSFFVDLYVFPPGAPVVIPDKDPVSGAYPLTSAAYAEVDKRLLPADSQYSIPPSSWRTNCGPSNACPAANWLLIFNQTGTWNVVAIVDSGNNVTEADTINDEWENDNTFQFTVESQFQGGFTYFPIVGKNFTPTLQLNLNSGLTLEP